jgi:hypothetical protein
METLRNAVSEQLDRQPTWHPEDIAVAVSMAAMAVGVALTEGWLLGAEAAQRSGQVSTPTVRNGDTIFFDATSQHVNT